MNKLTSLTDSQKLAVLVAQLADDKIAQNVVVIDLTGVESASCDYFVLCSTQSSSQSKAVSDLILENAKNYRLVKPRVEGVDSADWIVVDFFDVVCHIMLEEVRNYYKIEKLWSDGIFYQVNQEGEMIEVPAQDYVLEQN